MPIGWDGLDVGRTIDHTDPHATLTLQPYAYACWIISVIISTVLVWGRMYTKVFVLKSVGYEDCKLRILSRVLYPPILMHL